MMSALLRSMSGVCTRNLRAFDARAGRQIRQALERGHELGPAIGITRIVQGIDADDQILRAERFGPAEREDKKIVLRAGT